MGKGAGGPITERHLRRGVLEESTGFTADTLRELGPGPETLLRALLAGEAESDSGPTMV